MEEYEVIGQGQDKGMLVEKYKEISANRRHYSGLRFALLPFYFGIQGWIAKSAFNQNDLYIVIIFSLVGILSTYVFWTIEERILAYYSYLGDVAARLEKELFIGEQMFASWPKATFRSNTQLSIRTTFILCLTFWSMYLIVEVLKKIIH